MQVSRYRATVRPTAGVLQAGTIDNCSSSNTEGCSWNIRDADS